MDSTDGVKRGTEVKDTGKSISVPVGDATLGRVFNVLGDTIDLEEKLMTLSDVTLSIESLLHLINYQQKLKF